MVPAGLPATLRRETSHKKLSLVRGFDLRSLTSPSQENMVKEGVAEAFAHRIVQYGVDRAESAEFIKILLHILTCRCY